MATPDLRSRQTIFALSSAQGRAGVALIRVSGRSSRSVVLKLAGDVPPARQASLRTLRIGETVLDRALVLVFPGPYSFTGEDVVELHVHGGRAVVAATLAALGTLPDLRLAEAGEFTRRALEHERIDLDDAEALADLIDSETEQQRLAALRPAGRLKDEIDSLRTTLLEARALLEAYIDFSDEDIADHTVEIACAIREVYHRLQALIRSSQRAERLRAGFRVVLAGATNAGKSTLFNALAGRDAAIVSSQAGTTRDQLEIHLDVDGWPVTIVDTAGLRETADEVELEGIRRSGLAMRSADLILHLGADDLSPLPSWGVEVLTVQTKIDSVTVASLNPAMLQISAKTGVGVTDLLVVIGQKAAIAMHRDNLPTVRARDAAALDIASRHLSRAQSQPSLELQSEDLRLAIEALQSLTGAIPPDEILGAIFSRFCVGK